MQVPLEEIVPMNTTSLKDLLSRGGAHQFEARWLNDAIKKLRACIREEGGTTGAGD